MTLRPAALPCLLLLLGLAAGTSSAQTMTCGRDFAKLGDSRTEVVAKCGPPVAQDSFCRATPASPFSHQGMPPNPAARPPVVAGCEVVEEWTYAPGYGQFLTRLAFENGRLASIMLGDRVR